MLEVMMSPKIIKQNTIKPLFSEQSQVQSVLAIVCLTKSIQA